MIREEFMNLLIDTVKEIVFFYNEISVYLLFGFIVAGLLHILFPESVVRKHLGKNSLGSVLKSTFFGIPLPLCSCGVVPVAASLRKNGASKGATVSFLISTPEVGVDSFLVTYSLLGWVFGLFRIAASLLTALVAGIAVNMLSGKNSSDSKELPMKTSNSETAMDRLKAFFPYLEYELLGSIANTLVVGIIIAGIISAVIPEGFFERYLDYPFLSLLAMLVVGIPMYVCATASTPIAASLIMKGISPGAALVFLLTGPATNAVTISTVVKTLGKRSAVVYLSAIGIVSLTLGYFLNVVTAGYGYQKIIMMHQYEVFPDWLKIAGTAVLTFMLGWYYFKTRIVMKPKRNRSALNRVIRITVKGMTCMSCAGRVRKAVEGIEGTSDVFVDIGGRFVEFETSNPASIERIKSAIISAGFALA